MYRDLMVDIETTGTSPDSNGILQIAAVKFDLETKEISPDMLCVSMTVPGNRSWDEGTKQWWTKQGTAFQEVTANAIPPEHGIKAYYDYIKKDYPKECDDGLRFWSKPLSFDFPFISSYLRQYNLPNACHYRFARDLNSYLAGLRGGPSHWPLEKEIDFEGTKHNALMDVIFQIQVLFTAHERTVQSEVL